VRVSPLRSDIYGESRIFWDRTSSKSEGKFHGKFTVRDFDECGKPNAMNHLQWALWNGVCQVCLIALSHGWWLVNDPVTNPSSVATIGPASKGRGSTRWGKHRCTSEPQSPRAFQREVKNIEEVKKYAIFRNLRKGELNLTKPTLKWGWNGICIYIYIIIYI
jgi:hypothetical protein